MINWDDREKSRDWATQYLVVHHVDVARTLATCKGFFPDEIYKSVMMSRDNLMHHPIISGLSELDQREMLRETECRICKKECGAPVDLVMHVCKHIREDHGQSYLTVEFANMMEFLFNIKISCQAAMKYGIDSEESVVALKKAIKIMDKGYKD